MSVFSKSHIQLSKNLEFFYSSKYGLFIVIGDFNAEMTIIEEFCTSCNRTNLG